MPDTILIVDFGSQFTQLIARRVRELHVYSEIVPFNKPLPLTSSVKGIILSGGPASVTVAGSPSINLESLAGKLPLLGVCYGAQLMAQQAGGRVAPAAAREYGRARVHQVASSPLFKDVPDSIVWMSHADSILDLPAPYQLIAATDSIPCAAFADEARHVYGVQFHPEVTHSEYGGKLLGNFVMDICKAKADWTPEAFVETTIKSLKDQIGDGSVVCALSGGVDSTVAAVLLDKAIGNRLHCIFVDAGLLRKNEYPQVLNAYEHLGLNVHGVNAAADFLGALKGTTDPETKRKTIGRLFVEVFDREAQRIQGIGFLAQGTIYPDVIESAPVGGPSATIKSHHNVGGLPEKMNLQVVEPLRYLFKDEVRRVGKALGIPSEILGRHPFPGPGLAIRVLGEVTPERVAVLQEADDIYISELRTRGLYDSIWQAFAVLLPVSSVGVMGDERTYENVLALRAVTSVDGMTADWAHIPYNDLADISNKIINSVKGINRVVYDISSKPPATIEWE